MKNKQIITKMESKAVQLDKNKYNHNIYSGGRSPGDKATSMYKSM